MNFDIGPDIEVAADEYEDQQAVLSEMNAGMAVDPFSGINSCDALRIIDGVSLTLPEDEE